MITAKQTWLDYGAFNELGEWFAGGLFEQPDSAPILRFSRAYRRWFENYPMEACGGGRLYPSGKRAPGNRATLRPDYSYTWVCDGETPNVKEGRATVAQRRAWKEMIQAIQPFQPAASCIKTPHTIGGGGYTHAIVNYGRVLAEGLDSYLQRAEAGTKAGQGSTTADFYKAMVDLIEGIRGWHRRGVEHLQAQGRPGERLEALLAALAQVPFQPARNFYEAMVAYNVIYYLDGCDNPGRMEQVLWPYFQKDAALNRDLALALMREFFDNVCANGGWSLALGGSAADGRAAYQELTAICLEASHGHYRPSLQLRVRDDMPDRIWDLALDALASGCGQPAFYNEAGYLSALRAAGLGLSEPDIVKWNGGGCTETMVHGCSNVGSLDAGFNLPLILETTLKRELARDGVTFTEILAAYKADVRATVGEVTAQLNAYFAARAERLPQPVRSLFMDDCLDRGVEFNAGGARYNWSVVNVAGLANVADSLEAVRTLVFEQRDITPAGLLRVLESNFADAEPLRQRLLRCGKFGNDLASVDSLAAEIGEFVYSEILSQKCWRGGKFLPSHIMFETFGYAGAQVGATPDGRQAAQPLADSTGPVQGRDTSGPTALLKSVARLPQRLAAGTPVLNLRFAKDMFAKPESRRQLRALIETYFRMGGLQVQISVLDRAELLDALEHPDQHEDLIVRIGGYATHFNWLSLELKREVIKRTEYSL